MNNNKSTLLNKALSVNRREHQRHEFPLKELAELSVAWLTNKVTYTQVSMVLFKGKGSHGSNVYNAISMGLREAYRIGLIKTSKKKIKGQSLSSWVREKTTQELQSK